MTTNPDKALAVLAELCETIDVTGGVVQTPSGLVEPVGDRDWSDLGSVYLGACAVLGRKPLYNDDSDAGIDSGGL